MTEKRKTVSGAELPSKFDEFPDRVRFEPVKGEVVATFGDREIARTKSALRVIEGDYPPVLYLPRSDAQLDQLEPTDQTTFCPFKGTASYFSIREGGPRGVNAVWSYEDPFVEVAEMKDHLAFYEDKVEVKEG